MRIVPASVLAAAIALSAAACTSGSGSSSSLEGTPDQIVQTAVNNLKAATSVQISGNVVRSGTNVKVDVTDVAATGCQGTIGLNAIAPETPSASPTASTPTSGTADLIAVHSTVYLKLDEVFFNDLRLRHRLYSQVSGKYIEITSTSELASFAQLCDVSTLASDFDPEVTGFVTDGTATINGQATEAFKQSTQAGGGIVYVSESATPEIVRLQGSANEGQVNFTNYNAPVTITAPAASDVINGSTFGL